MSDKRRGIMENCAIGHLADYRNEWTSKKGYVDTYRKYSSNCLDELRKPVRKIRERELEKDTSATVCKLLLRCCSSAINELDKIANDYNKLVLEENLDLDKIEQTINLALNTINKHVN